MLHLSEEKQFKEQNIQEPYQQQQNKYNINSWSQNQYTDKQFIKHTPNDNSHLFKSADNLDQIKFFVSKNNENLQSPFNIQNTQNYADYQQTPQEYFQKNKSLHPYDNQQYQQNQYETPFQHKKSDKKTQHLAILNRQLQQLQKYSETMLQARNKQEDYMEEQQRQINTLQQELQSKLKYPNNNTYYLSQQQLQQQSSISKSPKFSFNYTPKNYERPTYTSKLKLRSKEMSQVSTGVVGSPQSQFNQ
ncbi:hypothetical protein PPERSA_09322 [Pseudocohnilembus persalinus]|uniref:Uncharacterized protein n=1 Tax=Pseudocohnilembus persalinus TaxID=266149 RepID=A0A0V0QY35_PSEPJ|nr:hypothetical protein PPERSA_09322 [Pseudocohnilembus persalinus]|eukprot:KRX07108.1 hypothetical protein PPERSA_09322 [Pseudocohnilembus persalinus]